MKALVVGGTGSTGPCIINGLLKRGYEVTMLHRGLHETELPPEVEHLHADPHWMENLKEALEGRSFDLVVSLYGRLRLIAEAIKGRTPRLISAGGALAVYKGWLRVTDPHPWYHMEESPVPVKEDDDLSPPTFENISLEDLKKTWMAKSNGQCVFISAKKQDNIREMRELLYEKVKEIHSQRYPYNDYLY